MLGVALLELQGPLEATVGDLVCLAAPICVGQGSKLALGAVCRTRLACAGGEHEEISQRFRAIGGDPVFRLHGYLWLVAIS